MIPTTRPKLLMPAPLAPRKAFPSLMGEIVASLALSTLDPAIAVMALLACISLATQGVANIAWQNGTVMPLGTSCLLVARSGMGKTLALKLLLAPIQQFLSDLALTADEKREPSFLMDDISRAAIVQQVVDWPIAGLFTDEASQLKDLLQNGAPTLAKLTDGTPFHHARGTSRRVQSLFHRVVMLLMLQPKEFDGMKSLLGVGAGGVGLINRCMLGAATASPDIATLSNHQLPPDLKIRYGQNVCGLLERTIATVCDGAARATLQLSPEAAARLTDIAAETRHMAGHDPRCADITEYLSRHAERTLRAAGAIHVFHHGTEGEVELESLDAAHWIGQQSIETYLSFVHTPKKPTQAEEDAASIEVELIRWAGRYGPWFQLSNLRRTCANVGLTKARFDRALPLLAGSGKVTVGVHQRQDWVYLNPSSLYQPLQAR